MICLLLSANGVALSQINMLIGQEKLENISTFYFFEIFPYFFRFYTANYSEKMTMKQIEQSLAMFRKSCAEKLSVNAGE